MADNSVYHIARELYNQGKTYEEILQILGIEKRTDDKTQFDPEVIRNIPYVGLRNWMLHNKITVCELGRRSGALGLRATIMGKHKPRQKTIDAILKVTGLTYEECFNIETGDSK